MLNDGEEALVRFRGRFEGDFGPNCEDIFGETDQPLEELLEEFSDDDLQAIALEMGCTYAEDYDRAKLLATITRRVELEVEPILHVQHYAERNKSSKNAFINCADAEAAVLAETFTYETKCEPCLAKQKGDKGISLQKNYVWTVYDLRVNHRVKSDDKDKKDEYIPCAGKHCRRCRQNALIDTREWEDIKKEERDDLLDKGYAPKYAGGNRLLSLYPANLPLINQLEDTVRTTYCRSCGEQDLSVDSAQCSACMEELDIGALIDSGWDPNKPYKPFVVECPHCEEHVKPDRVYACSCENPSPARLSDFVVGVTRTKVSNKFVWAFRLASKAIPLDISNETDAQILAAPLPDYEAYCKPPTEEEQAVFVDPAAKKVSRPAPGIGRGTPVNRETNEAPPSTTKIRVATGFKRKG